MDLSVSLFVPIGQEQLTGILTAAQHSANPPQASCQLLPLPVGAACAPCTP